MRSRTAQVDRIETTLRLQIPSFRDPVAPTGVRLGRDGKVYPAGERWDWRRIALRREAVAAILRTEPGASVRVVRDVLLRFGHRISHEQARADVAHVNAEPPGLVESRRWLPVDVWQEETERRRSERTTAPPGRSSPRIARRAAPKLRRPPRSPAPREASAPPQAPTPSVRPRPGRPAEGRDDWAVWQQPPRTHRGA